MVARSVLLALGGVALVAGSWTGLARAGVPPSGGPVGEHGILMVLGFLGTLIAVERAVALRARWAYAAPALAGTATVGILLDVPRLVTGGLLTVAGIVVTAVYLVILRHQDERFVRVMAAAAVAWVVAAGLWTAGWSPIRLAPMLAAFLVLTILGERLELSRLRMPDAAAQRRLLGAISIFTAGVALSLVAWRPGLLTAGAGMLGLTGWFVRHDLARVTIRRAGLPRFAAACMLAGYLWLSVGGLLWIALGLDLGGPLVRDAALHAVFLGFAVSMVMGHAPIILPAVLRVPLEYRTVAWVPPVVLHLTVGIRVVADLAGSSWGRGASAYGNVAALVLFVAVSAGTVIHARATPRRARAHRTGRRPSSPSTG